MRGVYLIGFSGTGKSTIARAVGRELGWPVHDLDEEIVARSGMPIPVIFEREGEVGFRMRETEVLRAVSESPPFVVATGGGATVRPENRRLMAAQGWVVTLEARPETLEARLQRHLEQAEPDAVRPMLDAPHPLDRIRALKRSRQSVYALADWTVHTDRLVPEQVVAEVVRAVRLLETTPEPDSRPVVSATRSGQSPDEDRPPPVVVAADPWPYQVFVGWNHLRALGEQVRRVLPPARCAAVMTDERAWTAVGEVVRATLEAASLDVHVRVIPVDERAKTLEEAGAAYEWLLERGIRRDDVAVLVGGSAIDGLGGFVGSTYLRGLALVKVPTSLEAMVDTAIGGETALNHRLARNVVGTFYQPRLAWTDVSLLRDEPARERRAAFAELVKYAMVEASLVPGDGVGATLLEQIEGGADALQALERPTLMQLVRRCVVLKAEVVAADERGLGPYRILLNYGHTLGHALETATRYTLLHGEAVAVGMAVEARIATRLGISEEGLERRQIELLERLGLPTRLPPVARDELLELVSRDKKVFGDAPRWILPTSAGRVTISSGVPADVVVAALRDRS